MVSSTPALATTGQSRGLGARLGKLGRSYWRHRYLILMFLPGFALFLLFAYGPLYGIVIAFQNYSVVRGISGSSWVGLQNFTSLFSGPEFLHALRNTVVFAGLNLVVIFPAPIVLALLLNECRWKWFVRLVQTISYLPHFISWVVLAGILFQFFGQLGAVNAVLHVFGLPSQAWLYEPNKFYVIYVVSAIWAGVGWGAIIYIAALAGVDQQLYEAARVDGSSRLQRMRHVSLPGIAPTISIMFLLQISHFLAVGFDQIYNLMTPITQDSADILDTYVLRHVLSYDFSQGMAAAIFQSVIGLVLVFIGNRVVRRLDPDQSLW
ncbi:ABC transporter permease subunit [Rugosimonospora acidiphila]|uniref:ABC transporter permease subunit n=1 Tax=Rugosimonospora acidiphila TaxID=556531 RepID=A0ABP9SKG3_9ACTN